MRIGQEPDIGFGAVTQRTFNALAALHLLEPDNVSGYYRTDIRTGTGRTSPPL